MHIAISKIGLRRSFVDDLTSNGVLYAVINGSLPVGVTEDFFFLTLFVDDGELFHRSCSQQRDAAGVAVSGRSHLRRGTGSCCYGWSARSFEAPFERSLKLLSR